VVIEAGVFFYLVTQMQQDRNLLHVIDAAAQDRTLYRLGVLIMNDDRDKSISIGRDPLGIGSRRLMGGLRPRVTARSARAMCWLAALVIASSATYSNGQANSDIWKVPAFKAKKANPTPADGASIERGKAFFVQECVACHGETGRGDGPGAKDLEKKPGNLTNPELWNQSDGALFFKITVGRRPMPSFRDTFSSDERWHIVNYIRTLASSQIPPRFEVPGSHRGAVSAVLNASYPLQMALADESLEQSASAGGAVAQAVDSMASLPTEDLPDPARTAWDASVASLRADVESLNGADTLDSARDSFRSLSRHLNTTLTDFGHTETGPVYLFYCPKAYKQTGAVWYQTDEEPRNPYMGPPQQGCGRVVVKFGAASGQQ
jgi:mono/diheme cytochrome c family protein